MSIFLFKSKHVVRPRQMKMALAVIVVFCFWITVVNAIGGNDGNTKLLLHADGADTSTTLTDSSSSAHTVTAVGNAQIDTAQSKFGGASALFDGSGDYLTIPDSTDWFNTDSFTIDAWFRTTTVTGQHAILYQQTSDGNHGYGIAINGAQLFAQYYESGAYRWQLTGGTVSPNTWHHAAFVKNGNSQVLYLDGVAVDSAASSFAMLDIAAPVSIGHNGYAPIPYYWNGWIDEVRFSNVARWTANFTPPTAEYDSGEDPPPPPPPPPLLGTLTFQYESNGYCVNVSVNKSLAPSGAILTIVHADGFSRECGSIATAGRVLQRSVELRY